MLPGPVGAQVADVPEKMSGCGVWTWRRGVAKFHGSPADGGSLPDGGYDVEIVNLKGADVRVMPCGNCVGSSSDSKVRADKSTVPAVSDGDAADAPADE